MKISNWIAEAFLLFKTIIRLSGYHRSQVTAISHGPTLLHSLLVVRGQLSVIQRIMRRHVKFALLTLLLFCSILVDSKMNEETNNTEIVKMLGGENKLPLATDTGALPFKLSNH